MGILSGAVALDDEGNATAALEKYNIGLKYLRLAANECMPHLAVKIRERIMVYLERAEVLKREIECQRLIKTETIKSETMESSRSMGNPYPPSRSLALRATVTFCPKQARIVHLEQENEGLRHELARVRQLLNRANARTNGLLSELQLSRAALSGAMSLT